MEKIRTIGLYQPYASLMLHGKIESRWVKRGKKPPFPLGKYLIYSTKKAYSMEEFARIAGDTEKEAMRRLQGEPTRFKNGYAIAIGELTEVVPFGGKYTENLAFVDTDLTYWQSPDPLTIDGHVLWALKFENVQRIKPFPFKGKQGVGFVPAELIEKIEVVEPF
jgi:hypothetical protein